MKIVNICMGAPFTEGYSYQDSMLPDYQHRLGHDVTVITGLKTRNSKGEVITVPEEDTVLKNGVRLIRIAPKGVGKLRHNVLGVYPGIRKKLEELSPNLIMVHGLGSHVAGYAVSYKRKHPKTHLIADNHQDFANSENPVLRILAVYFRMRWKRWIRDFDRIYAVTSWRKAFAHQIYGIPYDKLDTLILGIDERYINLAADPENRETVRKQYGIDLDCFVFCTGGKLDEKKKILESMRAFSQTEGERLRYLIFGSVSPDIREAFEKLLREDGRFVYIGYVPSEKTNSILAASDFGLFPGSHSVLWEQAIGCGLPCLFHQFEEQDHTDVNGNCIRLKDAKEKDIFRIMERVSIDPAYYRDLKQKSAVAAERFSYRAIALQSMECATGADRE